MHPRTPVQIPLNPAEGIQTGYQNTSGKVFSKVLPFERNGGLERTRTIDKHKNWSIKLIMEATETRLSAGFLILKKAGGGALIRQNK
jgi:hypothetical protein